MTREEEIKKAVQEFREERKTAIGRAKRGGWYFADIFEEGIKWADEHPKLSWISVNDDLPCNHEELLYPLYSIFTKDVLVMYENNYISLEKMIKDDKGNWKFVGNVLYWMPIPELSKE